ncbi:hypothetical protein MIND_01417200 [Mycena indigotica]|uniref:Uncharacterized protein n=1 Tax=Mycena indigotica TaxID=2126181 RepID=A0A8H6VPL8_9AGAR|nr:uncharacterized protein MIND_01417200 [Mycena indigotica]KAF7289004.1 hypothetical protein MIND_01417200 [Mycena indigotica]
MDGCQRLICALSCRPSWKCIMQPLVFPPPLLQDERALLDHLPNGIPRPLHAIDQLGTWVEHPAAATLPAVHAKKDKSKGTEKGPGTPMSANRSRSSTLFSPTTSMMAVPAVTARPSSSGNGGNGQSEKQGGSTSRRPSVASLLSLRRKNTNTSTRSNELPLPPPPLPATMTPYSTPPLSRSATMGSSVSSQLQPEISTNTNNYHLPRPPPPPPSIPDAIYLQQPHVHPGDDLSGNEDIFDEGPRTKRSDKAARMLGGGGDAFPPDQNAHPPAPRGPRPRTAPSRAHADAGPRPDAFYTAADGWYADDAGPRHAVSRDSRDSALSPIAFRPPSLAFAPPGAQTAYARNARLSTDTAPVSRAGRYAGSDSDRDRDSDEGVDALRPPRVDSHVHHAYAYAQHARRASLASAVVFGGAARPDTPFMDSVLAGDAAPGYAYDERGAGGHTREQSVVRAERGWQGEWNQGDMREVIQKLRTLR